MPQTTPKNNFSSSLLVSYLRNEINSGNYRPGDKMESVRLLAERLGVGRQIVLYALGQLVKRGLLVSSARRGYYISPDFKPNRFYRIGLLVNDNNPLRSPVHEALYFAALYYGYQLILFHNFESGVPAEKLLQDVHDLDGVIITGRGITDSMLADFAKIRLPYVVLGHYDLSAKHPVQWFYDNNNGWKKLSVFIKKRHIASAALIMGPRSSISDRGVSNGYQRFLNQTNPECQIETVFAKDNGYQECRTLLTASSRPQLLIFAGEHVAGYRKFAEEHPELPRPTVAITQRWEIATPPELFDLVIPDPTPEEYRDLMQRLLNSLNCL